MPTRIDTHFHMIPPFWAEALVAKVGPPTWGMPDWSLASSLEIMDRLGTRTSVISLSAPSVAPWDGQERIEMARRVNDYASYLQREAPGRFGSFATLPMPDAAASVAEIRRAYDDGGADGIIMLTSYKGTYLGDERFRPVWEELERRQAVVYLHPGSPNIAPLDGVPEPTFDFPMDSTRSALEMVASGVLDRYPSVKIILSHAGGFLPYAARRFAVLLQAYTMQDRSQEQITEKLRSFYFDTALSTPDALPSLLAFADPSRILFGSDSPYIDHDTQAMFTDGLDTYPAMPAGLAARINSRNAEDLFPRLRR